jgi:general stress protein 26
VVLKDHSCAQEGSFDKEETTMKLSRVVLVSVLGIGIANPLVAQAKPAEAPSRDKVIAGAKEIMAAVRYCTLITIGPDGQPQARVVDAVAPDSGFIVWIGTNGVTRKVADIRKDPRVTLMYFNESGQEYETVIGKAVVDDDMAHKAAHWKPSWGMMVKDGYRGPDFVLIRVQAVRLEVSSVKRGIFNDPVNWRPSIVDLR